ncbi:hypothetical protein GDO78_010474 [Eleutherodactylus coqui]|uniref:Coiled-coil domain-containing protein 170-like n=1 Tax=Eleutherodactylus coqui TaxID=57060 RepID=A0A8J6F6L6_ELECQ|nr:hypothetical protein GDO78_010474 [Eleutherodactylus coqui]
MSDVSNQYSYDEQLERLFQSNSSPSRSYSKFQDSPKTFPEFHDEEHSYTKNKDGFQKTKRHYYDLPDSHREDEAPYNLGIRDQLLTYKIAAESAQSEHAALLVKNTVLQAEVSDLKKHLTAKDVNLHEIKEELEKYKEKCARQLSQIQTLKGHIKEFDYITSEKAEKKAEMQTLHRENKEFSDRIKELEDRLRLHLIEREKAEQKSSTLGKRLHENVEKLSSCLHVNIDEHEDPLDALVSKAEKLMMEYKLHKSRIASLEDALASKQVESKASRDTIVKLVTETEKHKKALADYPVELKSLKKEKDEATLARKNIEREKEILHEKLKDSHKEWGSFRQEVMEKEKKINDLERTLRTSDYEAKASHSLHQSFISQLATILSNGFTTVPRTEEAVKEKIQELCSSEQTWKTLKKFLVQLAEKMKISQDISSESVISQYDMLLNRADAIFKKDKEFQSENKTVIYNLQKKLNSQREKLELKSSQVEQLEKKIKEHEREKEHQTFLSAENSATMTAQKLQKKVERLQGQLSDMKIANQNLTARLVDMNDLKEKVDQQKKTIELLSKSLEKLEKIKDKAAKKVVSLKTELDYTEHESVGEKVRCQQMVEAVTNELHTAKRALEEVARREKQLVDFRETITRMMGFNINTLAVPDFEIFDQLKQVLRTHGPIENTKIDRSKLPYGFRTGNGQPEYTVQHMNPRH